MSICTRLKDFNNASITAMCKLFAVSLTAIVLVATATPAHAFLARPVIFAMVGGVTTAPSGWLQYCLENPAECQPSPDAPHNIVLTPDLLQQLYFVNRFANDRVKWISDLELYGKIERWTMPLDRGDCEDIVLLKRRLLAEAGWPIGALLITTVEDPHANNDRHAVLTVHTDRGEFILDSQTPEILLGYETNYRYLTRQSRTDPNVWVLVIEKPMPGTVIAAR